MVASPPDAVPHARNLIERLQQQGGTIRIEAPDEETRAFYRRTIHAAKQHKLVPDGFHLKHTGRARGDLVIRLADDSAGETTDWNRIRLNTRRVTTDPSLVFAALEADPAGLHVTEASLARTFDLLHSLTDEARLRGHRMGVNAKTRHPKIYLQIGSVRRTVTVHEAYDQVPHVPTDQDRRAHSRPPWLPIPETDKVASGRLRLEVARPGYGEHDAWVDQKQSALEERACPT